jgi:hypothetical protein
VAAGGQQAASAARMKRVRPALIERRQTDKS